MAMKIDFLLQDAAILKAALDNNKTEMENKGFTEARYNSFVSSETELRQKEAAQQNAVKLVNEKTAAQNESLLRVTETIKMIQKAAKAAFGNNMVLLKKFRIGEVVPPTVKKLATWAEYFTGLTLEYKDTLLANGITETDLADLNASYGLLISTDAAQENAKKLQVAATMNRNTAVEKLKEQIFKTRNFAQACFAKNPDILVQFKPLSKGRGAAGKEEEPKPESPAVVPGN